MKSIMKRICAATLCLLLLCASTSTALASKRKEITVGNVSAIRAGQELKLPTINENTISQTIMVPLSMDETTLGGELLIRITSSQLDFFQVNASMMLSANRMQIPRQIEFEVSGDTLSTKIKLDSVMRSRNAEAMLLFTMPQKAANGTATVRIDRVAPNSFDASTILSIGEYDIVKQGRGANKIEPAAGLSGLTKPDTVYIISKAGKEQIRFLLDGTSVMGLAILENGIIAGVEYSFINKAYTNTLTQRVVISKDSLIDIFQVLDFSFMKAPNESDWLAKQPTFSVTRSVTF